MAAHGAATGGADVTNSMMRSRLAWNLFVVLPLLATFACSSREPCRVGDEAYEDGTVGIPAGDGCNTCICQDGQLTCTAMYCGGTPCVDGDIVHEDGTTGIAAGDGCNTCFCQNGQLFCSQVYCKLPCVDGDIVYEDGTTFPASDGCNTCFCSHGQLGCTLMDCRDLPGGG
jgi:hypothetical protein